MITSFMIKVEEYVCGGREDDFHIYGAARQGKVAVTLMTLLYIYIYIIIDIYYNIYKM